MGFRLRDAWRNLYNALKAIGCNAPKGIDGFQTNINAIAHEFDLAAAVMPRRALMGFRRKS